MRSASCDHLKSQSFIGYAYAYGGVHTALHILRDELASVRGPLANGRAHDPERVISALAEVLTSLAATFTLLTRSPCRACIKTIEIMVPEGQADEAIQPDQVMENAFARTLCRDLATARAIGHADVSETEAPVRHNTDFRFLFLDVNRRYYVNNNLPKDPNYENTSKQKYGHGATEWALPYKAVMVWPIRIVTERDLRPESSAHTFTGQQDIIGYLAVDSPRTNCFNPDLDFEIGATIADALFIFLDRIHGDPDVEEPRQQ